VAKKRKTPTTTKRTPSSAPPLSKENNRKESWWRTLLQHPTVVVASVLITLLGISVQRWLTELGENTKLRSQLELAQEQVGRQRTELENLRKKNEELASLHPILQFYGTNAKVIASYDLKKEVGSRIRIGSCPQAPCFVFTMRGIIENQATVGLKGSWGLMRGWNLDDEKDAVRFSVSLKKGCRTNFRVHKYDVDFVIEDDRYLSLKAGIGISVLSSPVDGVGLGKSECP
jgi:hypothetical protein